MKLPITLLIASLLLLFGCNKKDAVKPSYDFSYPSGTLYTGDNVRFSSSAPTGSLSHWYFGNIIFQQLYGGITNSPCDTCTDYTRYAGTPYRADTASGNQCAHIIYTPGTYTVVLTVGSDTNSKVKKVLTFLSPEGFDTGVSKMRHWSRSRYVFDGFSSNVYPLSDTDFAISITNGVCTTPKSSFGLNWYLSSSSKLVYEDAPNPHTYPRGCVIYTRASGQVTITENLGSSMANQNTYNYTSNF